MKINSFIKISNWTSALRWFHFMKRDLSDYIGSTIIVHLKESRLEHIFKAQLFWSSKNLDSRGFLIIGYIKESKLISRKNILY